MLKNNNDFVSAAPFILTKEKWYGLPINKIAFFSSSDWSTNDFLSITKKKNLSTII